MAIMDRIVRVGLSENAILILMHVVIFSPDGLQLTQRHFVEQVQIEYLNLLYRWAGAPFYTLQLVFFMRMMRIRIKEFKYLTKKWFLSSGNMIRILIFYPSKGQ